MATLKDLAAAGRTVVASVHQPRSSIFAMMDDLVLLSEGRAVYTGPAQQVCAATRFLSVCWSGKAAPGT